MGTDPQLHAQPRPERLREVAKFLAGIAANETLGHWWLAIWGKQLLPMPLGWFTFTEDMNRVAIIVWPTVLAVLVWFAWLRAPAPEDSHHPAQQ